MIDINSSTLLFAHIVRSDIQYFGNGMQTSSMHLPALVCNGTVVSDVGRYYVSNIISKTTTSTVPLTYV